MKFYKVMGFVNKSAYTSQEDEGAEHRFSRAEKHRIGYKAEEFNHLGDDEFFFVVEPPDEVMVIGVICRGREYSQRRAQEFAKAVGFEIDEISGKETTFRELDSMLEYAMHHDFIDDARKVLDVYDLNGIDDRIGRGIDCFENLLDGGDSEKQLIKSAERLAACHTLIPEIKRIYEGKKISRLTGHPVHYIVRTDDRDNRRDMYQILLNALYENGRIENRRYIFFDVHAGDEISLKAGIRMYKSIAGGAVVMRYLGTEQEEDDQAAGERATINKLCTLIRKYSNEVLTILCLPRECTKEKQLFMEELPEIGWVEVKEEVISGEETTKFLKMLAKEAGVRTDRRLMATVDLTKQYLPPELKRIFNGWFTRKMRETAYPQYNDIAEIGHKEAKKEPTGSAYTEFDSMIGLTEAKEVILRAVKYFKAQRVFAGKGMKEEHPSMHMVFAGNPGTAKTTTARLFAAIMREEGILSSGHLLEVGRSDLVGRYVGWTAKIVKDKFRQAEGGVLFIDEAYSLVDDRSGSYGDEAINTIVQEMENHRENVVVIFAGYPDKMKEFLDKNPGLRSRIAYHVPFADYNDDELCEIATYQADKKGLKLSDDAYEKLRQVFARERQTADFGNGRVVRNILEKARMAQAVRLLEMDYDSVRPEDITTIRSEDILLPEEPKAQKKALGFSVA